MVVAVLHTESRKFSSDVARALWPGNIQKGNCKRPCLSNARFVTSQQCKLTFLAPFLRLLGRPFKCDMIELELVIFCKVKKYLKPTTSTKGLEPSVSFLLLRPVRMRLDLNTNMEMIGVREPYKATYKVYSNVSCSDRDTSYFPFIMPKIFTVSCCIINVLTENKQTSLVAFT